jgi:membrane protein YqaA with SNARE-associated domain
MEFKSLMAYILMFITAFSSATLIPMGSEAVLLYNLAHKYDFVLMFSIAVIGNTLGSFVNYYLGYKGEEYLLRKNYIKEQSIKKHKITFDKYGSLALLLAWVPILGDGLTFVAGMLKYNLVKFSIYVFFSKLFRYAIVVTIYYQF